MGCWFIGLLLTFIDAVMFLGIDKMIGVMDRPGSALDTFAQQQQIGYLILIIAAAFFVVGIVAWVRWTFASETNVGGGY